MSEPTVISIDPRAVPVPPEFPALRPSGAALRAEVAEILERDLLLRFTSAGPCERVLIETVATLAADLAHLTRMFAPGCDPRIGPLLLGGIKRVTRGLHMLGTDRIADTFAERILIQAIAIEGAVLANMPPAGTACSYSSPPGESPPGPVSPPGAAVSVPPRREG
jgi:hypothetical protein